MPTHVYLAALCIGASVPLLVWSLSASRSAMVNVRRNLGEGLRRPVVAARRRNLSPRLLPVSYVRDLERRIERAGRSDVLPVDRYLAGKAVICVVALLLGGYLGIQQGGSALVLVPLITTMFAWVGPDLRLTSMAEARETEVEIQLPDVLDQLTISIEAGLGFDAAMFRLVDTTEGPVVDQLARALQDIRLGIPRDEALRGLAERTESPDLRTFANAIAQAGKHGLPLGNVLRAQAAEAREKRKFRAEERAHKVPVKILMPLVLCVLPTLFLVLIGPAIIRYNDGFGG